MVSFKLSLCLFTCILIITVELNEIQPEEPSDVSTSHSSDDSTKIQDLIGSKDTKLRSPLTHRLQETFEEPPVSDVKSSNIDKTEKEEQDILRLGDDDSDAKSRKQDENSSNQGLKDMRSSDLLGMLVSRRTQK